MKIFYLFCIFYFGLFQIAHSQSFKLTGKMVDSDSKEAIAGVYVTVKNASDTTKTVTVVTNSTGSFNFSNLQLKNKYLLYGSFLGYSGVSQLVTSNAASKDLGIILMKQQANRIGEVVIKGDPPASVQKGDTTEMNAGAFKVNRDATAEDLIKKMPGVTVDNGTLKAHGEEVKKVLVDGKAFFGDDPSVALKNLPAEVIDKVQVFNKLSEQSEMTGFDDGNSTKTINIITKQNRRNGLFGNATAGTDFNDKYIVGVKLNKFKDQQRLSINGLTNNINQQNFGSQDLITGGGGGGRSFGGGQQQGVNTMSSAGLNYTNNWGKKLSIATSYFFNGTDNNLDKYTHTKSYIDTTRFQFNDQYSNSNSKNANNRINMRLEWKPDTLNTIVFTPRLSFQSNHSNNIFNEKVIASDSAFISSTINNSYNKSYGNNLGSELVYMHRFYKPRRTFSIGLNGGSTDRTSDGLQWSNILKTDSAQNVVKELHNQISLNKNSGYSLSSNLSYTEPFGQNGLVQLNNNISFSENKSDKQVYSILDSTTMLLSSRVISLSNLYKNNYTTNRSGLTYRFKKNMLNFSLGADYQLSMLDGNVDYPILAKVSKKFENILPNLMIMYRVSKQSNIRFNYRTSTNAPSISQLQNVVDNSNSLRLSIGNPDLIQEYSHNLLTHIIFANPEKNTSFSLFMSGSLSKNIIGNQTITALHDTTVFGVLLHKGMQISRPINLDQSISGRSMINYSFPIKPIKSKLNFILGGNYSVSPGYISSVINKATSTSITSGLVLSSNISENVDFTISYTNTYSHVDNDKASRNNTTYRYQSVGAKINLIFLQGFVFQSDILGQYNTGLGQGFDQNYILWNGGLGKKFLKSKNAELKVSVYDLLNQSKNISRTVTAQSITDMRFNTLHQYAMLTFTYTIRNFQQSNDGERNQQRGDRWMGGERPMGDRPGGDRQGGDRQGGGPGAY